MIDHGLWSISMHTAALKNHFSSFVTTKELVDSAEVQEQERGITTKSWNFSVLSPV